MVRGGSRAKAQPAQQQGQWQCRRAAWRQLLAPPRGAGSQTQGVR